MRVNPLNRISVLGFGFVMFSLGVWLPSDIPRKVQQERAKIIFLLGTATILIGGGIDYYYRQKDDKLLSQPEGNIEFWQSLEREVYQNQNQN